MAKITSLIPLHSQFYRNSHSLDSENIFSPVLHQILLTEFSCYVRD